MKTFKIVASAITSLLIFFSFTLFKGTALNNFVDLPLSSTILLIGKSACSALANQWLWCNQREVSNEWNIFAWFDSFSADPDNQQ